MSEDKAATRGITSGQALNGVMMLVLLFIVIGCRREVPPPAEPLNVVLVMVDTLRADHMSAYGYERQTTPEIDSRLASGVLFERTRSQSACTFPSVNSLLTSRYSVVFNRQDKGDMGIPDSIPSLAEILSAEGYSTIAVSASPIVRATPSKINPGAGYGRGFGVFDEMCLWRPADCVNRRALKQIDLSTEPFFLYLHYMDPHDPYVLPANRELRFAGDYDGLDFVRAGNPNPIADMLYADGPKVSFEPKDLRHLVDLYDDEIAYLDEQLGVLLRHLEERGLLDRSIVVLTADHGEAFLEHEHIKHCRGLYDTLTHTPLIVWAPGVQGGRRVESPTENVDVVPTVLDLLGIPHDRFELEGISFVPTLVDDQPTRVYAFSDQGRHRSVDDGTTKVILDGLTLEKQMYDLHSDPAEQHDIFDPESPEAKRLIPELRSWIRRTHQGVHLDEAIASAKEKEDRLRALGYLE